MKLLNTQQSLRPLLIILILFAPSKAWAAFERRDFIIVDRDTNQLFYSSLDEFLGHSDTILFYEYQLDCWSSDWAGYKTYWTLEGDSLFLSSIVGRECKGNEDANLIDRFGNEKPFADWYSGMFSYSSGNIKQIGIGTPIFEEITYLTIENGLLTDSIVSPQDSVINWHKRNYSLERDILELGDTLSGFLTACSEDETIKNLISNDYVISYTADGNLDSIWFDESYIETHSDLMDNFVKALSITKLKKILEPFSLAYLDPHRSFAINVEIWYYEKEKTFRVTTNTHHSYHQFIIYSMQ